MLFQKPKKLRKPKPPKASIKSKNKFFDDICNFDVPCFSQLSSSDLSLNSFPKKFPIKNYPSREKSAYKSAPNPYGSSTPKTSLPKKASVCPSSPRHFSLPPSTLTKKLNSSTQRDLRGKSLLGTNRRKGRILH